MVKSKKPKQKAKKTGRKKIKTNQQNNDGKKQEKKLLESTKLSWLPKKTFELEFTVPWSLAKQTYDQVLKQTALEVEIKGFRKGKAPIPVVEKNIDKQKLYEEVIKKLLPLTYQAAVAKHNLRPIINPKIQVISLKEGQDWTFKATACEMPEVDLNNYQKAVKGELAKAKIWVPGKGDKKPEAEEKNNKDDAGEKSKSYDEKLKKVTETLLKIVKVEVPDMLVEEEVNRMLSRLLDQVSALGMSIDQYLNTKGLTKDQLKKDFAVQAEKNLKMEFILQAVITDRSIKVEKQEIDKMIAATPDEKVRKSLETPTQKNYIASILAKRKALDFLTSL
jgi:FKBP-type peptidyl-prolyl cis-trans isomerase (trigger factor)